MSVYGSCYGCGRQVEDRVGNAYCEECIAQQTREQMKEHEAFDAYHRWVDFIGGRSCCVINMSELQPWEPGLTGKAAVFGSIDNPGVAIWATHPDADDPNRTGPHHYDVMGKAGIGNFIACEISPDGGVSVLFGDPSAAQDVVNKDPRLHLAQKDTGWGQAFPAGWDDKYKAQSHTEAASGPSDANWGSLRSIPTASKVQGLRTADIEASPDRQHSPGWQPGGYGKGIIFRDGAVHTWNTSTEHPEQYGYHPDAQASPMDAFPLHMHYLLDLYDHLIKEAHPDLRDRAADVGWNFNSKTANADLVKWAWDNEHGGAIGKPGEYHALICRHLNGTIDAAELGVINKATGAYETYTDQTNPPSPLIDNWLKSEVPNAHWVPGYQDGWRIAETQNEFDNDQFKTYVDAPEGPWQEGGWGKAIVTPDNKVVHWKINQFDEPHHMDVGESLGHPWGSYHTLAIAPDGQCMPLSPSEGRRQTGPEAAKMVAKEVGGYYQREDKDGWDFIKPPTEANPDPYWQSKTASNYHVVESDITPQDSINHGDGIEYNHQPYMAHPYTGEIFLGPRNTHHFDLAMNHDIHEDDDGVHSPGMGAVMLNPHTRKPERVAPYGGGYNGHEIANTVARHLGLPETPWEDDEEGPGLYDWSFESRVSNNYIDYTPGVNHKGAIDINGETHIWPFIHKYDTHHGEYMEGYPDLFPPNNNGYVNYQRHSPFTINKEGQAEIVSPYYLDGGGGGRGAVKNPPLTGLPEGVTQYENTNNDWRFGGTAEFPHHNWVPGTPGKALIGPDGEVHTWSHDQAGNPTGEGVWRVSPHHYEYVQNKWGEEEWENVAHPAYIQPDGTIHDHTGFHDGSDPDAYRGVPGLYPKHMDALRDDWDFNSKVAGLNHQINYDPTKDHVGRYIIENDGTIHTWGGATPHHFEYMNRIGYPERSWLDGATDYKNFDLKDIGSFEHGEIQSYRDNADGEKLVQEHHPQFAVMHEGAEPWRFGSAPWNVIQSDFDPYEEGGGTFYPQSAGNPLRDDQRVVVARPSSREIFVGKPGTHHGDLIYHHGLDGDAISNLPRDERHYHDTVEEDPYAWTSQEGPENFPGEFHYGWIDRGGYGQMGPRVEGVTEALHAHGLLQHPDGHMVHDLDGGNDWDFTKTTAAPPLPQVFEHEFPAHYTWLDGRRPIVYDMNNNAVHVGPPNGTHMEVTRAALEKGHQTPDPGHIDPHGDWYSGDGVDRFGTNDVYHGWIGSNPEFDDPEWNEDSGDPYDKEYPEGYEYGTGANAFGWYTQPPHNGANQALQQHFNAQITRDHGWHFTKTARALWVDDEREAPSGYDHAHNVEEAKQLLTNNAYDHIALDHDLHLTEHGVNPDAEDGTELAEWMVQHNLVPSSVHIHSANPRGAQDMYDILKPHAQTIEVGPAYSHSPLNPTSHHFTSNSPHEVTTSDPPTSPIPPASHASNRLSAAPQPIQPQANPHTELTSFLSSLASPYTPSAEDWDLTYQSDAPRAERGLFNPSPASIKIEGQVRTPSGTVKCLSLHKQQAAHVNGEPTPIEQGQTHDSPLNARHVAGMFASKVNEVDTDGDGDEDEGRPFIHMPHTGITYLGHPHDLHWDLIRGVPELSDVYGEEYGVPDDIPGHSYGRLYDDGRMRMFNINHDHIHQIEQDLSTHTGTPTYREEGAWTFSSLTQRGKDDSRAQRWANALAQAGAHVNNRPSFKRMVGYKTLREAFQISDTRDKVLYHNWKPGTEAQDAWHFASAGPKVIYVDCYDDHEMDHGTNDRPFIYHPAADKIYVGPLNAYHEDIPYPLNTGGHRWGLAFGRWDPKAGTHDISAYPEYNDIIGKAFGSKPQEISDWGFGPKSGTFFAGAAENGESFSINPSVPLPSVKMVEPIEKDYTHGSNDHPFIYYPELNEIHMGPLDGYHADIMHHGGADMNDIDNDNNIWGRYSPGRKTHDLYGTAQGKEEMNKLVGLALGSRPEYEDHNPWKFSVVKPELVQSIHPSEVVNPDDAEELKKYTPWEQGSLGKAIWDQERNKLYAWKVPSWDGNESPDDIGDIHHFHVQWGLGLGGASLRGGQENSERRIGDTIHHYEIMPSGQLNHWRGDKGSNQQLVNMFPQFSMPQEDDWKFGASNFHSWKPRTRGKFIVTPEGDIHTWNVKAGPDIDPADGRPHHREYANSNCPDIYKDDDAYDRTTFGWINFNGDVHGIGGDEDANVAKVRSLTKGGQAPDEWYFGAASNITTLKGVKSSYNDAYWPEPPDSKQHWQALKTKDRWHIWPDDDAHASYMKKNGIPFEDVEDFAHYAPAQHSSPGWHSYLKLKDDYKSIYDSLDDNGSPISGYDWHFGSLEHVLNWKPGSLGKGLIDKNGVAHTWNTENGLDGDPSHAMYIVNNKIPYPLKDAVYIGADGRTKGGLLGRINPLWESLGHAHDDEAWRFGSSDLPKVVVHDDGNGVGTVMSTAMIYDPEQDAIHVGAHDDVYHRDLNQFVGRDGYPGFVSHHGGQIQWYRDHPDRARLNAALSEHYGMPLEDGSDQWAFSKVAADSSYIEKVKNRFNGVNLDDATVKFKASQIENFLSESDIPDGPYKKLMKLYGYLAKSKGRSTTAEDVHDAWVYWTVVDRHDTTDDCLVPYDQLSSGSKSHDEPYKKVVHKVADWKFGAGGPPRVLTTETVNPAIHTDSPLADRLAFIYNPDNHTVYEGGQGMHHGDIKKEYGLPFNREYGYGVIIKKPFMGFGGAARAEARWAGNPENKYAGVLLHMANRYGVPVKRENEWKFGKLAFGEDDPKYENPIHPWEPGYYGKFIVTPDRTVHHWRTDDAVDPNVPEDPHEFGDGWPSHFQYATKHRLPPFDNHTHLYGWIKPNGEFDSNGPHELEGAVDSQITGLGGKTDAWKFTSVPQTESIDMWKISEESSTGQVYHYPEQRYPGDSYEDWGHRVPTIYDHRNDNLHIGAPGEYHDDLIDKVETSGNHKLNGCPQGYYLVKQSPDIPSGIRTGKPGEYDFWTIDHENRSPSLVQRIEDHIRAQGLEPRPVGNTWNFSSWKNNELISGTDFEWPDYMKEATVFEVEHDVISGDGNYTISNSVIDAGLGGIMFEEPLGDEGSPTSGVLRESMDLEGDFVHEEQYSSPEPVIQAVPESKVSEDKLSEMQTMIMQLSAQITASAQEKKPRKLVIGRDDSGKMNSIEEVF